MKINGNAIRPGNIIEHQGRLWVAVKIQHTQPGKGGAYLQVELKDIRNNTKMNERFRSSETVEKVRLDEVSYQFLYMSGDDLTMMDTETFEQANIPSSLVGEPLPFLVEGMIVTAHLHDGEPVIVTLPDTVILEVIEADPVVKGQTATASYKPAKLSNNVKIMVPPHIEAGVRVVVNTADSTYVERAKE